MGMHAQAATEYLILLAVVMMIALVSLGLLGFYPGLARDAKLRQSEAYWRGTSPIAITGALAESNGVLTLALENHGTESIAVTATNGHQPGQMDRLYDMCAGHSIYMSPGQNGTMQLKVGLSSGTRLCSISISFTYNSEKFNNLVQAGSRDLWVQCPASAPTPDDPLGIACLWD